MRALRCAISLTAIGAVTGLALSAREVLHQRYLAEGLWRTSIWVSCEGALTGAAAGLAICAGAGVLLWLWSVLIARTARHSRSLPALALREHPAWANGSVVFLAALTALAALAVPQGAPRVLGVPYRELIYSLAALLWLGGTALATEAAASSDAEEASERQFELHWVSFIWAVAALGLLHGIVLAPTSSVLIGLAPAALGLAAAALFGLRRQARALHTLAAPRIASIAAGRTATTATAVVLLLVPALWLTSWSTARQARARARHQSVIFIAVDALRADRVSLLSEHEYRRDLTPNLRRLLAPRATIYRSAITSAPWTLPAFSSMFTGLDPREHGAEFRGSVLAPARLTLAELARESGYRTLAVTSGAYVTTLSGMSQGFEYFDDSQALGQHTISSAVVTDKALGLLRATGNEPFLLFLHYFDPHWVYQRHEEFPFARDYGGWLRDPASQLNQEDFRKYLGLGRTGRPHGRPEDLAYLSDLYDGEVAYVDRQIGRLLQFVEKQGLRRNTLLVFVADHGEELFDHGNVGHQTTLFQELIHVPLAIAPPAAKRQTVVMDPVETRALFRTVLDFLGIGQPQAMPPSLLSDRPPGTGLARSANHTISTTASGPSGEPADIWWTSVQDQRWKLIKEHLHGGSVLFDLQDDPHERRSHGREHPQQKARLLHELDRMDTEVCRGAPSQLAPQASEEQRRRLKSLGYL